MEWMTLPLKRYAQFTGRSRPKEFWMFFLFILVGLVILNIVETVLGLSAGERWVRSGSWWYDAGYRTHGGPLSGLFMLAMLIPYLAVAVRRLHDTDRRGWWLLIGIFPLIGGIVLLVFFIMSGTRGPNRFGADPVETSEP
jgi:uncharacterized membrane protein YhaH (DUF805 family)